MSKNKIMPVNIGALHNFPFIEATFDATTEYQMISELAKKVNELIMITNNVLEDTISDYIESRFNDMMLSSMYEEETETLVLYMSK